MIGAAHAGLPLFLALRAAGKQVSLANLTFTYLGETNATYLASDVAVVTPATIGWLQLPPAALHGALDLDLVERAGRRSRVDHA